MNITETITAYLPNGTTPTIRENMVEFEVAADVLLALCQDLSRNHALPLKTVVAVDDRNHDGSFKIFYVFGVPKKNVFIAPYLSLRGTYEFPSITSVLPEAHFYEREIKEFFGLEPVGHPNPSRWLLHVNWPEGVYPLRKDFSWNTRPEVVEKPNEFSELHGEGVFEIPVGPVHAGIIEPGHFRFGMAGEEIVSFEPRLGYVHKGIEKLFETLPFDKKIALSEHVSGDTSFTHSLAFCQALELLAGSVVPVRAQYLRVVFSELERLANHIGDVGLILLGCAFNFGAAQGARLREMIVQINERLTASRFLRGVNVVGGVMRDLSTEECARLQQEVAGIQKEFIQAMAVVDKSLIILNRLSGTGTLPLQTAKDLGAVGVVAKGSGIVMDARKYFPYAAYAFLGFEPEIETSGDVYARFRVRVREVYSSCALLQEALSKIPAGPIRANGEVRLAPLSHAVGIAEGWRGDVVYFVATDAKGEITRVHVRDASFLNWPLFIQFAPGNVVLDFPLMNKSCNLSYSGNDK